MGRNPSYKITAFEENHGSCGKSPNDRTKTSIEMDKMKWKWQAVLELLGEVKGSADFPFRSRMAVAQHTLSSFVN